jgi:hypothetical protein
MAGVYTDQRLNLSKLGKAFGIVGHQTIGRDLGVYNSKHTKTATNPKGSGRRKGSTFAKQLKNTSPS